MAPTAHQGTRATVPSSTQFSSVSSISLGSGAPLRSDFYVGGPASAHKLPLSSNGPSSSAVGLGTSADSITPVSMQPPAKVRKLHDGTKQSRTKQRSSLKLEQYVHKSPHRHWVSLRSDLAQRLDPSHAAVKISYDPSTIARDILIIADRHPTERFLNQHLEILRKNLGCVDYSTDLATLRWDDLIDPVVPRDGPTTSLPRPEAHPVNTAPAEITTPAPKPRLTSSGTLPFKPPPYHSRPRDTAISASTTYSPIPPWLSHIVPSVSPICRTPTHSSSVPAPLSPPAPISEPTPESVLASSAPAQTKQAPADTSETDPFEDRRPESRSPQGRLSQVQPTHVRPAPVNLPAVSCNSISNGSNLPPTSRLKASQQTPTPAGPTQPQVVIPPSPHNRMAPKKKPGRPKRDSANLIEVAIPPGPVADRPVTEYQVFPCKWTDCRSELHNLAAIKAHVIKVHIPHHIVCAWQGCQDSTPRAAADMIDHIYRAHISPMAWALGDGPVVSAPGKDLELLASHLPSHDLHL
ncbi:hypothetical protein N7462_005230 [Penicillium macrosclerotiorum]|uniref:uncharacterized protein n=1 Tax=Penicillium macrosclerotiorum TaxID=303699 RepID=UPI0025474402|nr:uncharacterized protein N7462_005230 [Penicillium macrosclerotiorum]KAJ5690838.1 hypothetical protein N7462_005230 [Penicillium macrosclerotiorum]